jgi:hypothetical protein
MFRGTDFKRNTLMTAFLFPGVVFTVFLILDIAVAVEGTHSPHLRPYPPISLREEWHSIT